MTIVEEYLNKANDEYKKGEDYKNLPMNVLIITQNS